MVSWTSASTTSNPVSRSGWGPSPTTFPRSLLNLPSSLPWSLRPEPLSYRGHEETEITRDVVGADRQNVARLPLSPPFLPGSIVGETSLLQALPGRGGHH